MTERRETRKQARQTADAAEPDGKGLMGDTRKLTKRSGPGSGSGPKPRPALVSWPSFLRTFVRVAMPYWRSEQKGRAWFLSLALFCLTVAQVGVPVAINRWMRELFDSLQQHSMDTFGNLLLILLGIIVANVVIVTFHLRVKRALQIGWRDWLSREVVDRWMQAGRHYQLGYVPGPHDNPDGRIAEDARIATEYAVDLAHSFVYSLLLLVSFTEILWSLSEAPYIVIDGASYYVPGYLVWIAVAYAGLGTVIALSLGRALIRTVDRRQTAEADYRFSLAHARENALGIALAGGEVDERRRFRDSFKHVVDAWNGVTRALANMFYYSSTWSVLSHVFPTVVVAPRFLTGLISLGELMQGAQAFQQMVSALSWAIDNLGKVADWRASAERVFGLNTAVEEFDKLVTTPRGKSITVTTGESGALKLTDVSLETPTGEPMVEPFSLEVKPGDRVLMTGETGSGSTVLKAIADLWPWGDGRIERPKDAKPLFMPPRPYLPAGPLRNAIDYPAAKDPDIAAPVGNDAAMIEALKRVGLEDLSDRLDESANWEQALTVEDQQRLGFVRLLLSKPDWIFMEEAADTLDPAGRKAMVELLRQDFPKATILALGHSDALGGAETRRLTLERDNDAVTVREVSPKAAKD